MKKIGKTLYSTGLSYATLGMMVSAFAANIEVTAPTGEIDGFGKVLGVIQYIGILVAVVMVMYVGVKYLTAGASKKAEAKETMVPVLIGAALLALAPSVVKWIFTALGSTVTAS